MITDSFDDKTPSITSREAFYGPQKHQCDICIVTFSQNILEALLERFDCRKLAEITACNGNIPIYGFDLHGTTIAIYLSGQGASLAGGHIEESNWLVGARHYITFGSAGSLCHKATHGRIVVPTEAYRDEGMSYHYAPKSDYITMRNAAKVAAWLKEAGAPVVTGRCWTTDAFFRETQGLYAKRVAEGCIAVDMELAGLQAVCDFYGLELYSFLQTGDVLEKDGYDTAELGKANHEYANFELALKIAEKLAEESSSMEKEPSSLPDKAQVTFRTMLPDDYDAVYALWTSCDGIGLNDVDDSREGITRYLLRNPQTCFVANQDNNIVGVILAGHDGRRGFIYHLAIRPDCRRMGIARALVGMATDALRDCGISKVALLAFVHNTGGNIFWEGMGFTSRDDLVYRNYPLRTLNYLKRSIPPK
ncbi:MAG: GNAT family N-acetyltransferase [Victivallales bacterium]|nr:GNAT family N-acetyltransferase [Victivallales bacterium]